MARIVTPTRTKTINIKLIKKVKEENNLNKLKHIPTLEKNEMMFKWKPSL